VRVRDHVLDARVHRWVNRDLIRGPVHIPLLGHDRDFMDGLEQLCRSDDPRWFPGSTVPGDVDQS